MKQCMLWKIARVGCGTPAVPLEQLLGLSFRALMCKDCNLSFVVLSVGYPPNGGNSQGIYIYIYVMDK